MSRNETRLFCPPSAHDYSPTAQQPRMAPPTHDARDASISVPVHIQHTVRPEPSPPSPLRRARVESPSPFSGTGNFLPPEASSIRNVPRKNHVTDRQFVQFILGAAGSRSRRSPGAQIAPTRVPRARGPPAAFPRVDLPRGRFILLTNPAERRKIGSKSTTTSRGRHLLILHSERCR